VRFAKHDHVVETFAADRADEGLDVRSSNTAMFLGS
jgi:hypothetical protein